MGQNFGSTLINILIARNISQNSSYQRPEITLSIWVPTNQNPENWPGFTKSLASYNPDIREGE